VPGGVVTSGSLIRTNPTTPNIIIHTSKKKEAGAVKRKLINSKGDPERAVPLLEPFLDETVFQTTLGLT